MMPTPRHAGFTLIELLVAITIFAVLATVAYDGLNTALAARERIEAEMAELTRLQRVLGLLQRDIEQMVDRPVIDATGQAQPAFRGRDGGDPVLEFTRGGVIQSLAGNPSSLRRVAWVLDEETLSRRTWWGLDQAPRDDPVESPVLENIQEFHVRFLGADKLWREDWPPPGEGDNAPAPLPVAVEITLDYPGWGTLRRVFRGVTG